MSELSRIQKALKVGKENRNEFGKYNYRNCADILEAVKPLMSEGWSLVLSDEIVMMGDRFYVKAIAFLDNGTVNFSAIAYAREEESKKGMDGAQVTGAASSYARKYALNGLFAIDDTKDADSMDNSEPAKKEAKPVPIKFIGTEQFDELAELILDTKSDTQAFCKAFKCASLAELPESSFAKAKELLLIKQSKGVN